MQTSQIHEQLNHKLVAYPFYGRLVLSVKEADHLMSNINEGLQEVLAGRPICINQTPTPKARILSNVLVNIFVQQVQPSLSELSKAQHAWQPLLEASYRDLQGEESEALDGFYQAYVSNGPMSLWSRFKDTMAEHAALWTQLLGQCGMRPGG